MLSAALARLCLKKALASRLYGLSLAWDDAKNYDMNCRDALVAGSQLIRLKGVNDCRDGKDRK
jgi:hypothetical protein